MKQVLNPQMSAPNFTLSDSDLCMRCGLCCDGSIFNHVPLSADEFEPMQALGLDPQGDPSGGFRFRQPCPRLQGTLCSIYPLRPNNCRAFECKLLKQLQTGKRSGPQALAIVAEARRMIDEIKTALGDADSPIEPERWAALLGGLAAAEQQDQPILKDGETVLRLIILNRFLDRHFRLESQRIVKERLVDDE